MKVQILTFLRSATGRTLAVAVALLVAAVFVDCSILLAAPFALGASLTEGSYAAEFLITEQPGKLSRSNVTVTVATATKLNPGMVLGKITASGKYVPFDDGASDGRETAVGVLYSELDNLAGVAPADFDGVVIDFGAEVIEAELEWESGATEATGLANLAARFIKAR